jgi:hypothetical protein
MKLRHSRPSLTSPRGEPNPLTAVDLHLREHIEFLDRIVRADVDARIAKLRAAGHPKAQALEAEYLRLNRRLRTTFLAFGKSIEDLERFERQQLAPASPTPQSAVESPSFA